MLLDKYVYRGVSTETGRWVYGHYFTENQLGLIRGVITNYDVIKGEQVYIEVERPTVGQFSTFFDKRNKPIFDGDVLLERRPERDTQTHYGDNIPSGEYTEPLEPIISEYHHLVTYSNGAFRVDGGSDDYFGPDCELSWIHIRHTLESAKDGFSGNRGYDHKRWNWNVGEDDDDLAYLLNEYNYDSEEELIRSLGVEVIADIHTHEAYKDWI